MKSKIAIAIYIVLVSALTIIAGSRDTIIRPPECKHMVFERNGWDVGGYIEGANLLMRCETAIPHYDTAITYGQCNEEKRPNTVNFRDTLNNTFDVIIFESMGKDGK